MVETFIRKRVEILVDTPLIPRIVKLMNAAQVTGWSITHVDMGSGRDGAWRNDELTGAAAKAIILAIMTEGKAQALVDLLAPILDSYGIIITIGDVQVVRGARF